MSLQGKVAIVTGSTGNVEDGFVNFTHLLAG